MSSSPFSGKVALVTGGAGGIGEAICRQLMTEGAEVILLDRPESGGAEVTYRLNAGRAVTGCTYLPCDLAEVEVLSDTVSSVIGQRPCDILVNNAAVNPNGPIDSYSIGDFDRTMRINTHAAFVLAQCLAPGMKRKGSGAIVNTTSLVFAGFVANMAPYVTSKGALIGMTRALARELGPHGIRVNSVSPGAIPTEMEKAVWAGRLEEINADVLAKQSLKFRGVPADIAEAVCFLASERSRFITGHDLPVNGGWYMG